MRSCDQRDMARSYTTEYRALRTEREGVGAEARVLGLELETVAAVAGVVDQAVHAAPVDGRGAEVLSVELHEEVRCLRAGLKDQVHLAAAEVEDELGRLVADVLDVLGLALPGADARDSAVAL